MSEEQPSLFELPPEQLVTHSAWVPICMDAGPFCIHKPTPSSIGRMQVLTCTRPRNHGGDHCYADTDGVIIAGWDRGRYPLYPPLISERTVNGSTHTL